MKTRFSDLKHSWYVPTVVFSYAVSSLGGVFVNKACLSGFDFGFPITLILLQLVFSVIALSFLRAVGLLEIPRRTLRDVGILSFPAVFFVANVSVGLYALRLVNIPMFSAFRRLTVINVMIMEYFVLQKKSSRAVVYCVLFMVVGSIVAALGDLTFDPIGYILVFINNILTAANLVAIKKASQLVRLDALPLFYYVSLVSLPIVCLLAYFSGDLQAAIEAFETRPQLRSTWFFVALCLSASSAFLINYTTNLCTQVTSALTTCITGQTKNILQTLIGIFSWGYQASVMNLLGLFMALVASCIFATVKYQESKRSKDEERKATEEDPNGKPVTPPTSDAEAREPENPTVNVAVSG
mmetsp:Transcript_12079/g.21845  ORF Transcript_12079/g.21845 Transcript_12079/m.21845 type:complete len:354 (-) Transcript_12079:2165-3226(-)